MAKGSDVIVIGGGIVGAACARALGLAGARVTLLRHPAPQFEGWRAAAGMLAAQVEAGVGDPMFGLALAGRAFYRRHAEALKDSTGIDIELEERGILQIARSEGAVVAAKAKVAWQRQQAYRADWLDRDEVAVNFPGFDPGMGGFWATEDGQVHPQRTVEALLADSARLGVRIVDEVATGIALLSGRLEGVVCLGGSYNASTVVVANGAWSCQLANLPRPIAVAPVYGRLAIFPWPLGLSPAIIYGHRCYLMPRGGELIAGATMEHPGFSPHDDPAAFARMLGRVADIYPQLLQLTPDRTQSGLRPGTPDGLPIIGPEPRLPGLWYATGHGRNGVLMAGITGELVAQGIGGQPLSESLAAASPERFWSWSES